MLAALMLLGACLLIAPKAVAYSFTQTTLPNQDESLADNYVYFDVTAAAESTLDAPEVTEGWKENVWVALMCSYEGKWISGYGSSGKYEQNVYYELRKAQKVTGNVWKVLAPDAKSVDTRDPFDRTHYRLFSFQPTDEQLLDIVMATVQNYIESNKYSLDVLNLLTERSYSDRFDTFCGRFIKLSRPDDEKYYAISEPIEYPFYVTLVSNANPGKNDSWNSWDYMNNSGIIGHGDFYGAVTHVPNSYSNEYASNPDIAQGYLLSELDSDEFAFFDPVNGMTHRWIPAVDPEVYLSGQEFEAKLVELNEEAPNFVVPHEFDTYILKPTYFNPVTQELRLKFHKILPEEYVCTYYLCFGKENSNWPDMKLLPDPETGHFKRTHIGIIYQESGSQHGFGGTTFGIKVVAMNKQVAWYAAPEPTTVDHTKATSYQLVNDGQNILFSDRYYGEFTFDLELGSDNMPTSITITPKSGDDVKTYHLYFADRGNNVMFRRPGEVQVLYQEGRDYNELSEAYAYQENGGYYDDPYSSSSYLKSTMDATGKYLKVGDNYFPLYETTISVAHDLGIFDKNNDGDHNIKLFGGDVYHPDNINTSINPTYPGYLDESCSKLYVYPSSGIYLRPDNTELGNIVNPGMGGIVPVRGCDINQIADYGLSIVDKLPDTYKEYKVYVIEKDFQSGLYVEYDNSNYNKSEIAPVTHAASFSSNGELYIPQSYDRYSTLNTHALMSDTGFYAEIDGTYCHVFEISILWDKEPDKVTFAYGDAIGYDNHTFAPAVDFVNGGFYYTDDKWNNYNVTYHLYDKEVELVKAPFAGGPLYIAGDFNKWSDKFEEIAMIEGGNGYTDFEITVKPNEPNYFKFFSRQGDWSSNVGAANDGEVITPDGSTIYSASGYQAFQLDDPGQYLIHITGVDAEMNYELDQNSGTSVMVPVYSNLNISFTVSPKDEAVEKGYYFVGDMNEWFSDEFVEENYGNTALWGMSESRFEKNKAKWRFTPVDLANTADAEIVGNQEGWYKFDAFTKHGRTGLPTLSGQFLICSDGGYNNASTYSHAHTIRGNRTTPDVTDFTQYYSTPITADDVRNGVMLNCEENSVVAVNRKRMLRRGQGQNFHFDFNALENAVIYFRPGDDAQMKIVGDPKNYYVFYGADLSEKADEATAAAEGDDATAVRAYIKSGYPNVNNYFLPGITYNENTAGYVTEDGERLKKVTLPNVPAEDPHMNLGGHDLVHISLTDEFNLGSALSAVISEQSVIDNITGNHRLPDGRSIEGYTDLWIQKVPNGFEAPAGTKYQLGFQDALTDEDKDLEATINNDHLYFFPLLDHLHVHLNIDEAYPADEYDVETYYRIYIQKADEESGEYKTYVVDHSNAADAADYSLIEVNPKTLLNANTRNDGSTLSNNTLNGGWLLLNSQQKPHSSWRFHPADSRLRDALWYLRWNEPDADSASAPAAQSDDDTADAPYQDLRHQVHKQFGQAYAQFKLVYRSKKGGEIMTASDDMPLADDPNAQVHYIPAMTNFGSTNRYFPFNQQDVFAVVDNDNKVSALEEIEANDAADDAEAIYYNLQGIRVSPTAPGIYIRVSGTRAEKVYLKKELTKTE